MIIVAGTVRVPLERVEELREIARQTVEAVRTEDGCILYSFSADLTDPGLLRIYEQWESREHLKAHLTQPHMKPWRDKLAEIGASGRDIKTYEAGEGTPV